MGLTQNIKVNGLTVQVCETDILFYVSLLPQLVPLMWLSWVKKYEQKIGLTQNVKVNGLTVRVCETDILFYASLLPQLLPLMWLSWMKRT